MNDELTYHERAIADELIGLIDYAGRVLIAASYGSSYQLDKIDQLQRCVQRLAALLAKQTVSNERGESIRATVAWESNRYTLGWLLLDSGHLGGTA